MFTLNEYFGYMIKATIDPDFNGNFFMENTHHRGRYAQYYPAFMNALVKHLKSDFEIVELIACFTPSWQETVALLKKNREMIYQASEKLSKVISVSKDTKNLIDEELLYMHASLFVALYIEHNKDQTLVGKSPDGLFMKGGNNK